MPDTKAGKELLDSITKQIEGYRISRNDAAENYARTSNVEFQYKFNHYDFLIDIMNAHYTRVAVCLERVEQEVRNACKQNQ